MYGKRDDGAQLALMDAMVFFTVCAMICATMVSYASLQTGGEVGPLEDPPDIDRMLEVLLDASLGDRIVIGGAGLELTGSEDVSEAVLMVSSLVLAGSTEEVFSEVLLRIESILCAVCAPWMHEMSILFLSLDGWAQLLDIGTDMEDATDVWCASQNMGSCRGVPLLLTLALSPALLPHGV